MSRAIGGAPGTSPRPSAARQGAAADWTCRSCWTSSRRSSRQKSPRGRTSRHESIPLLHELGRDHRGRLPQLPRPGLELSLDPIGENCWIRRHPRSVGFPPGGAAIGLRAAAEPASRTLIHGSAGGWRVALQEPIITAAERPANVVASPARRPGARVRRESSTTSRASGPDALHRATDRGFELGKRVGAKAQLKVQSERGGGSSMSFRRSLPPTARRSRQRSKRWPAFDLWARQGGDLRTSSGAMACRSLDPATDRGSCSARVHPALGRGRVVPIDVRLGGEYTARRDHRPETPAAKTVCAANDRGCLALHEPVGAAR